MRKRTRILAGALSLVMCLSVALPAQGADLKSILPWSKSEVVTNPGREKLNFNQGWKFVAQNIPEATSPDYDMTQLKRWENVNLPHSIRLEPVLGDESNPTYQEACMYVKHFPLTDAEQGKKLYLKFEGVMGVTDVWVNGEHMHTALADHTPAVEGDANTNYGGYLPFVVDITDVVKYDGTDNVVTVLADNRDNGDVPPGKPQSQLDFTYFGGIYRNVWLEVTDKVHITDPVFENIVAGGGVYVEYPEISKEKAVVAPKTHVRNESKSEQNVTLKSELLDREGKAVGTIEETKVIPANADHTFKQSMDLQNPHLWNLDDPYLHTLVSTVTVDGVEVDRVETTIGIRKFEVDRTKGLLINGEVAPLLQGGNRHQDYPVIGNAASDALQYRDAVKFKEAGFNIVRAAHYPMSEEFIRGCNELGLLLYEAVPGWQWYPGTEIFDLRVRDNLRQLVRRDRNNPCMLAYETVLNEAYNVPKDYTRISSKVVLEEDPNAKIATEGQGYNIELNGKDELADIMFGRPDVNIKDKSEKALGFCREYGDSWTEDHNDFQARRLSRGKRSETGGFYPGGEGRMIQQANNRLFSWDYYRGVYSYDDSLKSMYQYRDNDPGYLGGTMWTAQDNRGYGSRVSLTGIWDHYRLPKFAYYAYESQRPVEKDEYLESKGVQTGPSLFIGSYWGEKAPDIDVALYGEQPIGTDAEREIYVYSNAEKVKLTVEKDGEILWTEEHLPLTNEDYPGVALLPHPPFEFSKVPYTKGSTLKAVGYDADGKEIASQEITTAGEPAKLKLEADYAGVDLTADGSDMIRVYAYVLDADGNVCPEAINNIKFATTENASVVGDGIKRVGANPVNAEAGIATVYVQAGNTPGTVTVTAESEGLESGTVEIEAKEMTDKAAAYVEIPREGPDMNSGSMYLAKKQMKFVGEKATAGDEVKLAGQKYDNSLTATQAYMEYDLDGMYQRLTTKIGVADGKEPAIFKVYTDGVLRYVSEPVSGGTVQAEEIDLDITGTKTLRLMVESTDKRLVNGYWLAPYVYEGQKPVDNSELYKENLAFGKAVEATHGKNADKIVDGSSETLWQGDVFQAGQNQSVTIDLGKVQKIRNTKIELGVDNTTYNYDVYTSADGNKWDKKASAERTGWTNASGYLDKFTAEARYVRVTFTGVSDGLPAALREVTVYPDFGVDSVTEYNLKGLRVEGKNIAFTGGKTNYEVDLKGYETEFVVRAWAEDKNASISVNGKPVANPEEMENLDQAVPVKVSELDENNNIIVKVTPASGYGQKVYTIHVNGEFCLETANYFDAADCFVPGYNNMNAWSYQEYSADKGYVDLADEDFTYYKGDGYWLGSQSWLRVGPAFMHPGENGVGAVKTFTAPKDGDIALRSRVTSQGGGVRVQILLNDEVIWPEDGGYKKIVQGPEDITAKASVKAGDKVRMILDADGGNGMDATQMPASVTYTTEQGNKLNELSILGKNELVVMENQKVTSTYSANGKTGNGDVLKDVPVLWSLKEAYDYVSIDANGQLTVDAGAVSGNFVIVATHEETGITAEMNVTLEVKENVKGIVKDQSQNQFDANLNFIDTAALENDGEETYLKGYFAVDNEGARETFNHVIGGTNNFTIEAVIRPNVVNEWFGNVVVSKGDDTATMRIFESNLNFFIKNTTGNWVNVDKLNAFTAETAKEWHHVAAIYNGENGGTISVFLDGKIAGTETNVGSVNTAANNYDLCIGKDPVKGNTTKSDFKAVRVYSEALDEETLNAEDSDKLARDSVQLWYDFTGKTPVDPPVEPVETDKEWLSQLIGYAQSQQENEDYQYVVPAVKEAFEKALAEAIAVYEDETAAQETVDAASDRLLEMVQMLGFTGNSESLELLVKVAREQNLDLYTPESRKVFEEALAKAEEVLADSNALQEEIDAARDALQAAMDGLEVIPVDKDKLQKLVNKAKKYEDAIKDYTPATAEIFEAALAHAREVLEKDGYTQEEVDAAYTALNNAIFGLRLIPNKDKLEDLINSAKKVDVTKYTAETAAAFTDALAKAEAVFADENATADDVKAAEKALKKAQKNLVAKTDVDADKKADDKVASTDGNNKPADKAAKTGDVNAAVPAAVTGIAALAVLMALKKRR